MVIAILIIIIVKLILIIIIVVLIGHYRLQTTLIEKKNEIVYLRYYQNKSHSLLKQVVQSIKICGSRWLKKQHCKFIGVILLFIKLCIYMLLLVYMLLLLYMLLLCIYVTIIIYVIIISCRLFYYCYYSVIVNYYELETL